MFATMHTHSYFSKGDAVSSPKDIVTKVKSLGQTAVALTDHGETSGLIEMYEECQKQGIHFVFGVEHYLCPDVFIKDGGYKHICIWAKNNIGYQNLLQLTTEANDNMGKTSSFYKKPRIDLELIRKYSEGLAISSACLGGWLKQENGLYLLEEFKKIFPNDLYIELHTYSADEQKEWNLKLLDIAKEYDVPLLAATDSHYVNREDAYVHKMWVSRGKEQEDGYYQTEDFYLHSEDDVRDALSYLPSNIIEQSIINTQKLADECQVEITFGEQHYPQVNSSNPEEDVKTIVRANWMRKTTPENRKYHKDRIAMEMPVLRRANYFPYFLIMHEVLEDFRKHEIPISPSSRGSAGGCDVAYLMDIHQTDPLKYDLLFARFLHDERVTPCDIDTDISKKRREEAIELIKIRFGHDRVFQARTYNYMSEKSAFQRAGQALHVPNVVINKLSKYLPKVRVEGELYSEIPEEELKDYPDLVPLAKSFVGILQNWGVHASAVIIFPDDPCNYTAIEKSGDNYVTAYEFHTLESLGILKLDILGVKTIDVLHDTQELLPEPLDLKSIPHDDSKTFDMLCAGETKGVFQIEGHGFSKLVQQIQPRHFEDLAPLLAVYRPAIISAGLLDTYIKRRTGEETVEYLHPDLEPLLNKVYGLMIYQENIIEVAKTICGYTPGQADMIRRACGRKLPEEMAKIKPDFIQRGVAKGYSEEFITKLWELVEFFAGYGFGKAHTFGYGEICYDTAYLKANYPKEFMVSLINSESDQKDIIPYVKECERMGIEVLPPDLSKGNTEWVIEGESIRIGLHYIKGVGHNLKITPNDSFMAVVGANSRDVTEALIKSGALDYLGHSRGLLLSNLTTLQDIIKREEQCKLKITENQQKLSEATTEKDKSKFERQLKSWEQKLAEVQTISTQQESGEFDEIAGEIEVLGFSFKEVPKVKVGKVTRIYTKIAKNGLMAWITMLSNYGEFCCTCFAPGWEKIKTGVKQGETYEFVVNDSGILEEIRVDGTVVKTNERKRW